MRKTLEALSVIAAENGFADQAQMTRAMAQLFGVTPRRLGIVELSRFKTKTQALQTTSFGRWIVVHS